MDYSRRDLGKLALALPAAALLGRSESLFAEFLQAAKPNSKFRGVQIGTITYSYRSMPDQSAEAILKYIVDSGISAVELMGGPVDQWARAKTGFQPSGGGRGGGGRAGAAPAAGAPGAGAPAAGAPGAAPAGGGGGRAGGRGAPDPATLTASWNGVPCAPGVGPGGREAAPPPPPAPVAPAGAAAAAGQVAAAAGGGGRGGRGEQTPEQIAAAEETRKWRQSLSMDVFKDLRKLYNDAGVTIYAVKNLSVGGSNEDLDFQFTVAKTLGADHITAELPSGPEAAANLKRVGEMAVKHKMFAAYHTHAQGSMTAFDEAFAISKGNKANVDLGHFVAGGNKGGTPLDFLNKFHDRIGSFHLKDRTLPKNCSLNLAWGTGETPIKEILQLVAKNKWPIPASIELEYAVPEGSDAVKEVRKCVEYCRAALA